MGGTERIKVADEPVGFRTAGVTLREGLEVGDTTIGGELLEVLGDHAYVARTGVGLDGLQQVRGPTVMQEEQPLANTPQRCCTELIRARPPPVNAIRQIRSHVVT